MPRPWLRLALLCLAVGAARPAAAQEAGGDTLQAIIARGELRIGVAPGEPWFFKDQRSGEWHGLGWGLGVALAKELGIKATPVETTWGNAIAAMQAERAGLLNDAQGVVAQRLSDIAKLKTQLANYENRIIPALRRNYDTQLIAYEQNKGDLTVVIDAWETLNMTQMDYLTRLQDYYRMIVEYEKELER